MIIMICFLLCFLLLKVIKYHFDLSHVNDSTNIITNYNILTVPSLQNTICNVNGHFAHAII